jgi:geranylgeranyl pyrophosphate synthase
VRSIDHSKGVEGVIASIQRQVPALQHVDEMKWLAGRLKRLHRILPEAVIQAGGMGKVCRTIAGVLAIGAFDTYDSGREVAREHLARILPGAYAYGATYAIVDDTLHDLPGYLSPDDRERYHQMILRGLSNGEALDPSAFPDHPIAEELHDLYNLVLDCYPFAEYRHLYHAAEAMYLAQHRDASADASGLSKMYPDIFVKAGLSRVVANILGRRSLTDAFYARCINTIFLSQFKDDLADREEDARANRLTPFTFPAGKAEVNPLYDLFAYDAYVVHEVFGNDPAAAAAFTHFGTVKLAFHLSSKRDSAASLREKYETTSEIDRFLHLASGLPTRAVRKLNPADMRLQQVTGVVLHTRDQSTVDSRTFVTDRRDYLDEVIRRCYTQAGAAELNQIVRYSMDGSAKRLRPALTLMLAQSLGTPQKAVEPLLAAIELFHTSSLVFDDLPAQDNATLRRGKPAAHRVFDESSVQLAAISMLSSGFGLLAELDFPPERITGVIGYIGSVLGPERLCRGQYLDLQLGRNGLRVTAPAILEMYNLKTSTMIEAALVPLMMLLDRPQAEIAHVKRYAHHAGIVFQIRDDILDATASSERTGKDTGHDAGKVNLVRVYGLDRATGLMWSNVDAALDSCAQLPFSTSLLEGVVTSFAKRAS